MFPVTYSGNDFQIKLHPKSHHYEIERTILLRKIHHLAFLRVVNLVYQETRHPFHSSSLVVSIWRSYLEIMSSKVEL